MKNKFFSTWKKVSNTQPHVISWGLFVALLIGVSYGTYANFLLKSEKQSVEESALYLEKELALNKKQNQELRTLLRDREYTIETFGTTIRNISNTVGTLEKLSKTDSELLMKYSKVYFLNENYNPPQLEPISTRFVYNGNKELYVHANVWPYLEKLLTAAEDANLNLRIASAFRSFGTQATLKAGYTVTYGSGANTFSADQGYSEHQLGTTVDFTTDKVGAYFSRFESDPAYKWLQENAHKYGFILSYPKGNTYYKFEPWHWRFVGVELALHLHDQQKNFYELDQRIIDEYLVKIFD